MRNDGQRGDEFSADDLKQTEDHETKTNRPVTASQWPKAAVVDLEDSVVTTSPRYLPVDSGSSHGVFTKVEQIGGQDQANVP
jgi:hypothetical protein